jgi:hypothetical protein
MLGTVPQAAKDVSWFDVQAAIVSHQNRLLPFLRVIASDTRPLLFF